MGILHVKELYTLFSIFFKKSVLFIMEYDINDLRVAARTIDSSGIFSIFKIKQRCHYDKRKISEKIRYTLCFASKRPGSYKIIQNLFDLKELYFPNQNLYRIEITGGRVIKMLQLLRPFMQDKDKIEITDMLFEFVKLHDAFIKDKNKRNQNMRSRAFSKFRKLRLSKQKAKSKNFL